MPRRRGATVALDGYGAEQGFEALAEGARLAAADGIARACLRPARGARPRRRRRGRGGPDRGVDRQRRGPGPGGPRARPEASVVRAAARGRRGPRRRRWSAPARPGRRWPPPPSACAACRACSARRSPSSSRCPASRSSSSTSAPTSRSAPSTWSSSPSSAPPSARRCSASPRPRVGAALGRRGGGQGEGGGGRRPRPAERGRRDRLRRQRRGPRPAGGVADVVVTDGFTGNVALKLMEGTARTVTGAIRDAARSNPLAALGGLLMRPALGGAAARAAPRHDRRRDPARPARRSPSSATAAPAPRGSPTRCASPPAASRSTRSGAPRRCCDEGGAGRGALGRRGRRRVIGQSGDEPRRSHRPWSASTSPRSSRSTPPGSTREPASRRTSTPTRSISTSW